MCCLTDVNARSACDNFVSGGYPLEEALTQVRSKIGGGPVANEQAEDPWSSLAAAQPGMQAARQQLQLARRSRDASDVRYSSTVLVPQKIRYLVGGVSRAEYLRLLLIWLAMSVTKQVAPALLSYLRPEDGWLV
jgi:hypothetical protein